MKNVKGTKKVFIIVGPTSSGKTSLALDMCEKINGEIISADSRQVVKYMDIGTGKVPVNSKIKIEKEYGCWKLNGIKVWGYDLVTPDQYFSGFDFAYFALNKAREIIDRRKNVFIVGGTGFYIDLITGRMIPSKVKPDLELREVLESMSLVELQEKLREIDGKEFEKIDKNNKTRLVRAIEKGLAGKVNNNSLPYLKNVDYVWFGLSSDRDLLYEKADSWVDEIWDSGLIDEVKFLLEKGYGESRKLGGLVYKTAVDFLSENISEEDTIQRIKYDIHAYIRRQQTWFKKNKEIMWVDISQDGFKEIIYNKIKENI
ncbi:tRNA (adenosine(37)-N6)-dimethylallyltransferase MiaA [Patescibacteria group bacterium]|nr:tRNA (adenosine(37)-N6)-dimethylallyltransferase MiaA [Patescibacteria group bacterium]